jgi:hypothetical protein
VIRRYLEDLLAGDPVALTFTGIVAGLALLLLLGVGLVIRAKRRDDREYEERRRRRGY